jgi:signal transduction histidine kinase/PAS domain-containing protein
LTHELGDALSALLEFTGSSVGWVGVIAPNGRLTFPARRGAFPETWLGLQQGDGAPWGFGIQEGPTILNDLPALPGMGEPHLRNLLSCPLLQIANPRGQVVLANKPNGFTSHDAAVLQGLTHWIGHRLARAENPSEAAQRATAYLPCNALNRLSEGVFVLDGDGRLVYANTVWLNWTGFALDELLDCTPPYPFWISHRALAHLGRSGELPTALDARETAPTSPALPFRRRDDSVFWCHVESVVEQLASRQLVVAVLRKAEPAASAIPAPAEKMVIASTEGLPFAAALTNHAGRVIWANECFFQQIAPASVAMDAPLRECFDDVSATALQQLATRATTNRSGRLGSLLVRRAGETKKSPPLVAYWTTLTLPDGAGMFFGFSEDWAALGQSDDWACRAGPVFQLPAVGCLALLLTERKEVAFWDARWQQRTGLAQGDLAGVPSEIVLDWLFPQQRDRDVVADVLSQPDRQGGQALLGVLSQASGQPLLCTFLPVVDRESNRWLLLAADPGSWAGDAGLPLTAFRSFLRGLAHLLNHFALIPQGVAEAALDRGNLAPETAAAFGQILESCEGLSRLLVDLQELAAVRPHDLEEISLPALVREFLDELPTPAPRDAFELDVDLPQAGLAVRVHRRMIKAVLQHLFNNARDALEPGQTRRIGVRVYADTDAVACAITDTGEGLPTDDWMQLLAPFASTKGPFARDARHAAFPSVGLGLAVSVHLLALNGGRLELRQRPEGGVCAIFRLPRADLVAARAAIALPGAESLRADPADQVRRPHPPVGKATTLEPPTPGVAP